MGFREMELEKLQKELDESKEKRQSFLSSPSKFLADSGYNMSPEMTGFLEGQVQNMKSSPDFDPEAFVNVHIHVHRK